MRKVLDVATLGLIPGLASSKKKAAPAAVPAPATPAAMPTPDDEAVKRARKQTILRRMSARGRESTNLTGTKLGG